MGKTRETAGRAQCSIRLGLRRKGVDALEAINKMPGIMMAHLDNVNRVIIVDYDPAVVSFPMIQQKARGKRL
jgi:hypothetical protein